METTEAECPANLEIVGEIAIITLNRPDHYNSIDRDMAQRLAALSRQVEEAADVKVVIVRGAGRAFCAGGDINYFVSNQDQLDLAIRELLEPYHQFISFLRHTAKVTIASVHGPAAGAGLSLVSMCDLCVASDRAKFTPAYAALGVSPDGGGTYGLARAVGPRRALDIFLSQESFSAKHAADWGLVTRLVEHSQIEQATRSYAEQVCRASRLVVESTKRLIRESSAAELHDHLIHEMDDLIRCTQDDQFQSAVARFVVR
jgi:enoyl-CoA hydratase/carnithine racemase